jgi:hypothetical protein
MELACLFGHLTDAGRRVAAILVCSDHVFQAPLPDVITGIRVGLPLAPRALAATTLSLDTAIEFLIGYGTCEVGGVGGVAKAQ